ncbi:GNAT family N-acetyltransferase [Kribbella sp. VKM Ac-2566]|uniref:GNAT family N-acetyltransferase n=1 Tax=Kribbella sp. VKM Ac-2566 TaxID=2512218 RepID=UPI00106296C6|nr:GNAT family N-acetyltransferase [Kribbella sp. VKM Ac-2566]TDW79465.1 putative GNAT family acetyltransferase [Kribbella sp. VKM Ac-2566]
MRTLAKIPGPDLTVVENDELRRYELLAAGTTVGTLDFRLLGRRRVLGHTEIAADQRGRGLGTALIKAALDDLVTTGVRVTNYCPAVERFLQSNPEYAVVLDPEHPPMPASRRQHAPLQQLVHVQHSRLRELAARSQDPNLDGFERRRTTDQFAAVAAQHAAAVADVLLTAARTSSGNDAAVLLHNLKQFEQALRVLKGRAYGDARFLNLSSAETWQQAERLLTEHESTEARIVSGLERLHGADQATDMARTLAQRQWSSPTRPHPNSPHAGVAGRLARQLWRIADSTWDELEGRGLPTEPAEPANQHSTFSHYLFGTADDPDPTDQDPEKR